MWSRCQTTNPFGSEWCCQSVLLYRDCFKETAVRPDMWSGGVSLLPGAPSDFDRFAVTFTPEKFGNCPDRFARVNQIH